jgi:hypothetical protein
MRYLFDYGEFLICFAPVFFIIAFIFAALVWNNLPSRVKRKRSGEKERDDLRID